MRYRGRSGARYEKRLEHNLNELLGDQGKARRVVMSGFKSQSQCDLVVDNRAGISSRIEVKSTAQAPRKYILDYLERRSIGYFREQNRLYAVTLNIRLFCDWLKRAELDWDQAPPPEKILESRGFLSQFRIDLEDPELAIAIIQKGRSPKNLYFIPSHLDLMA